MPSARVEHLAAEARGLDAARMMALEPHKRYTLAAALVYVQVARARDDLGTMFVRLMRRIHTTARRHWPRGASRRGHRGSASRRWTPVIGGRGVALVECDAHLAHAGNNYYPFLWRHDRGYRATRFALLVALDHPGDHAGGGAALSA